MKGGIYKTKYGWQVRFGRKITKHFTEKGSAERFLTGLRFETDKGSFDIRDYRSDHPLGFTNLAEQWLDQKKKEIKHRSWQPLNNYMMQAIDEWGNTNVKQIRFRQIQKFLFQRTDISDKTRSNMKSCLHQFWEWVDDCEGIAVPKFPKVDFELGWRDILDIETQQAVLNKVKEISQGVNPKIYLAIKFLATYIQLRPQELVDVFEKDINLKSGTIVIRSPKEKKPKLVFLDDDDIELLGEFPQGLPDLPFFRHPKGLKGVQAGVKFGPRYLYKWWKKACHELGVEGVDLYGGTRHSTTTALSEVCTPEEVKSATGHVSKAFERYFQNKQARAKKVTKKIKALRGSNQPLNNILEYKKSNNSE